MRALKNFNLMLLIVSLGLVFLNVFTAKAETMNNDEINRYFDDALSAGSINKNPVENALKMLPRFGMDFFENPPLIYTSSDYVPITTDYLIGPGDEMTVTIWGIPEEGSYNIQINRDGMAILQHVGAVRLAGHTLNEARQILQTRFSRYFKDYQLEVSMGSLRSIMIYVIGNVKRPGAYMISSLSTLVNALLAAGGPSETGTLRNIELKRNVRTAAVFDMYSMLLKGDRGQDIRLQPGDVIFVPPVGPLVGLAGEVQRPGVYELNGKTKVKDLLDMVNGLTALTFNGRVQYYRVQNHSYRTAFEGSLAEVGNSYLSDGDVLRLFPIMNMTAAVNIGGKVARPGTYAIIPRQTRISDLLARAGGLLDTAADKAYVTRTTPTPEGPVQERFDISLRLALGGDVANNITLEQGDNINILVIPDWEAQNMVTIEGKVKNPGTYSMLNGEKISDLLKLAGGFTKDAFVKGAVFTRLSTAEEQKKSLQQMADQMERDMLEPLQNAVSSTNTASGSATGQTAEISRRRELINRLRTIEIMGRMIVKLDKDMKFKDTKYDLKLQNGDKLIIPDVPDSINVMGAVYAPSSQVYNDKMGINDYINEAGGAVKSAHKRMLYLLKSDGTVIRLTRSTGTFANKSWKATKGVSFKVESGDVIVVPVKYLDQHSFDLLKDTIDIMYKVALSVGVLIR